MGAVPGSPPAGNEVTEVAKKQQALPTPGAWGRPVRTPALRPQPSSVHEAHRCFPFSDSFQLLLCRRSRQRALHFRATLVQSQEN